MMNMNIRHINCNLRTKIRKTRQKVSRLVKAGNMRLIKYFSLINCVFWLLLLFIFSAHSNIGSGAHVQSRSIDNQDFCQLKLYRRQYFTDPKPKAIEHNSRHLRIYQVKSVRSIGTYSNITGFAILYWKEFQDIFYKHRLNYKP